MSSDSLSASSSLLQRVRDNNPEAWRRLVRIYGPLVYGWARKSGLQSSDASDVVQEVFASVAKSIDRFRRQQPHQHFRSWLWTICRNKVRDHHRTADPRPKAEGGTTANLRMAQLADTPPADESLDGRREIDDLRRRALAAFRNAFDEHVWKAFWRVVVDERAPSDVAMELGVSVWVVYKSKSRVLNRLCQELDGLLDVTTVGRRGN